MNFLKKILRKIVKKNHKHVDIDVSYLAKSMDPLIEKTATGIFTKHGKTLINQDNTYIVYAAWGAKKVGDITPEQKEINNKIVSVINETIKLLDIWEINEAQKYAIGYLLRGLFIAKINYMTDYLKHKMSIIESENNFKLESSDTTESAIDKLVDNIENPDNPTWFRRFGDEGFKRW